MKNIFDIGLTDVKQLMIKKGYKIFTENGVPNIIGIRSANLTANIYDDRCFAFWNEDGAEVVHSYTITTHPGAYYLLNPIAGTNGTAILVDGQYLNCWELGMHRGKQFALCQRGGEVKVYRDNNKNTVLDLRPETIVSGWFGIDLHHGSINDGVTVDRYSAGCQVWRYHQPHADLMQKFKELSAKYGFSRFSYTLLNQSDFDGNGGNMTPAPIKNHLTLYDINTGGKV